MLTGRSFRLLTATLAVTESNGKRLAITVPSGAILRIVSGPTSHQDRMVDVLWEGQVCAMFVVDVQTRGEEIAIAEAI